MKKLVSIGLMCLLVFGLVGCTSPFKKKETKKEVVKKETITSTKVKNTMKGETLTIGVSNEMPPFCFESKNDKTIVGFDVDLIKGISKYLGFQYKLVPATMSEISAKVKSGEFDCAIAAISITDARQKDFTFSDSYYENSIKMMVTKKSKITERKEIVGKTIGVVDGTSNADYVREYMAEGNKIKSYKTMKQIYKALEKGKIDVTIYDATGADYYIKEHKDTNIVVLDEKLNEEESNYGIMFAKGYDKVDEFNVALQEMNTKGTYQEIEHKWVEASSVEE